MSASLVGSEMCIRDRVEGVERCTGDQRTRLGERPTSRLESIQLCNEAPVSYTHLTLPTICSV
eukprot:13075642-Alexandrium_andersonii.AAC.1